MSQDSLKIDSIKSYARSPLEDREYAEFVGSLQRPASPPKIDHTPAMNGQDTIKKMDATSASSRRTSVPVLDGPKNFLDSDTFAKGTVGLEKLNNFLQASSDSSSQETEYTTIDNLFLSMMGEIETNQSAYMVVEKKLFDFERNYSDLMEEKRSEEIKKQIAANKQLGTWDKIEKMLSPIGLLAASVIACATGFVPLGVACGIAGTLLLVDQILDDAGKKAIANWLSKGDQEQMTAWFDRLQLFCACASVALSLCVGGFTAAQYGIIHAARIGAELALQSARGVTGGVKAFYEQRLNNQKSSMVKMDFSCAVSGQELDKRMRVLQNIFDFLRKINVQRHDKEEGDRKTMSGIARSITQK